jgi:Domain of unknown function (DUF4440)
VSDDDEVLGAARARADALGRCDRAALARLLHPRFAWTSHDGQVFDRETYLRANTAGTHEWHGQRLDDPQVVVVGGTAVLRCIVIDDVDAGAGRQTYRMPMTQTWVRSREGWQCLAGHAGPRLT